MKYIAHKDGEREQSVKEHLEGTAERAGEQYTDEYGFDFSLEDGMALFM